MFNKKRLLFIIISFLIGTAVFTFVAKAELTPEEVKALKEKSRAMEEKIPKEKKEKMKANKEEKVIEKKINTVKAKVDSIEFSKGFIKATSDDMVEMIFYTVRDETVIQKEEKDIKLEGNIREGDDIEVSYYIDSTGKFIATKISFIINADAE